MSSQVFVMLGVGVALWFAPGVATAQGGFIGTDRNCDSSAWGRVRVPPSQVAECRACVRSEHDSVRVRVRYYWPEYPPGDRCIPFSQQSARMAAHRSGSSAPPRTSSTEGSFETGPSTGQGGDPEHDSREWASISAESVCERRVPAHQRAECYACASGRLQHYHQYEPYGSRCHTSGHRLVNGYGGTAGSPVMASTSSTSSDPDHDSRDWSSITAESVCARNVPARQSDECYACASGRLQHYHQYEPYGSRCHSSDHRVVAIGGSTPVTEARPSGDPDRDSRRWSTIHGTGPCRRNVPSRQVSECIVCAVGNEHYHQYQPPGLRCHDLRHNVVRH